MVTHGRNPDPPKHFAPTAPHPTKEVRCKGSETPHA